MQIKLMAVFAFVLLGLVILLIRITLITARDGSRYTRKVLSQQSYDSRYIPYRRGEIQDRNGIVLARSDRTYNLILDCLQVNSDEAFRTPTINALKEVYGLDGGELRELLENDRTKSSQYQVLKKHLTQEEKEALDAYVKAEPDPHFTDDEKKAFRQERANVQGLWFEEEYVRIYPYDSLASNTIGFANSLGDGIVGFEAYYDSLLKGTNGRTFGYLNEEEEYEKSTIDPQHGKTLVMTLDMNIQRIVEEHIADFDEMFGEKETRNKGAENLAVLVMNPNNGEILAMASNSPFNLNSPDDLTAYYTGAEIKAMDEETFGQRLQEMWRNYCVYSSFEPGSTMKPITLAAALECGAVKDSDTYYCDGGEFITDTLIHCDNVYGHGEETLEYALVNSCNDALMQIGMKIGIRNFCLYQDLFGFGTPTGVDLPDESAGVVYNENSMHEVELATCTFGQGFTVTMLQEAAAFSAVINGGYYYQPHVLYQVQNPDGKVEKTVDPLLLKQPVSSQVSALLRRYLTTAVQKGTGRKSQVPGYLTGGKTGTAEKIDPVTKMRATGKYLISFIGACPMDDPQVVIYVVIDEPNIPDQADSTYPQILFREIASEIFPYMGLYPTEDVTTQQLYELDMTLEDVVRVKDTGTETFQAYDAYGNIYNEARVENGTVVSSSGEPIVGAYVNEDGNVVDGFGYTIEVPQPETEEVIDPVADNPDIAAPPDSVDQGSGQSQTTWAGVTGEDLSSQVDLADAAASMVP